MTKNRFKEILENRINEIIKALEIKGNEYSNDEDRLHNFKVAARIDEETPARSLWGMLKKHLVFVMDMIHGRVEINEYLINEKIGDFINFLILLEAVFREELEKENQE